MKTKTQKTWKHYDASQWIKHCIGVNSDACHLIVDPGIIMRQHPDGFLIDSFEGPIVILTASDRVYDKYIRKIYGC